MAQIQKVKDSFELQINYLKQLIKVCNIFMNFIRCISSVLQRSDEEHTGVA